MTEKITIKQKRPVITYVVIKDKEKYKWFPIIGDLNSNKNSQLYPGSIYLIEATYSKKPNQREMKQKLNSLVSLLNQNKKVNQEFLDELFYETSELCYANCIAY